MFVARVIGHVWATKKYPATNSSKFMIIQPMNGNFEKSGEPIIAIDTVGSGPGEYVYYITASEAVIPLPVDFAPVDASIVGIIDSVYTKDILK